MMGLEHYLKLWQNTGCSALKVDMFVKNGYTLEEGDINEKEQNFINIINIDYKYFVFQWNIWLQQFVQKIFYRDFRWWGGGCAC